MKKTPITLLLCLIVSVSFGQLDKRIWIIGGSAGYSSTKFESTAGSGMDYYEVRISPTVGYFLMNKFALGIKTGILALGSRAMGTATYSKSTEIDFGPFARYYFLNKDHEFNLLLDAGYQFGSSKGNNTRDPRTTFLVSAGPVIYFNSAVGLEFLIGYSSQKYSGFSGRNKTVQFSLGFQIHLEKDR